VSETPLEPTTPVRPSEPARDSARARRRSRQISRRRALALVALLAAAVAFGAAAALAVAPLRHALSGGDTPDGLVSATVSTAKTPSARATLKPGKTTAPRNLGSVTYAIPLRLVIPAISVDAAIESVGLTADGAMAAPSGPVTVGWLSSGARPGNTGSAVLDGHSGYANDRAAVFDDLPKLTVGDRIYVIDAKGRAVAFAVKSKRLYAPDAQAPEVFAATGGARLNLITCTGAWDTAAGTHSQRLVVFAVKEKSRDGKSAD
jgi:sortase (surface protein transpeptidase)